MGKDIHRTKAELLTELHNLRRRVAALERDQAAPGGRAGEETGELWRPVFERSLLAIACFNPDGTMIWGNEAHRQLFRATPDAYRTMVSAYNILKDEQLEAKGLMPLIHRAFAGETLRVPPVRCQPEMTTVTRDFLTEDVWVEGFFHPIKNDAGAVRKVVLIQNDLTQRMELERALRESQAALERKRERLRALTATLFTVQEDERRRVSRELHDDLNQKVAMLAVDIETLQQQLPSDHEMHQAQLSSLRNRAVDLSDGLRRIAYQLHPSILEHLGLEAALRSHCAEFSRRARMTIKFVARDVPVRLPEGAALCLYRVAQEALRNVVRHSGVRQAALRLYGSPTEVCLAVSDRGRGFDPAAKDLTGLGLISMEERVRLAGDRLTIKSRPGRGTRIEARIARPRMSSQAG